MKQRILLSTVLLGFSLAAQSAVVLSPDTPMTFQFTASSLTLVGYNSSPMNMGNIELTINSATTLANSSLSYSFYENGLSDAAASTSGSYSFPASITRFWFTSFGAWQDLQGALRLTAIGGPITIDQAIVHVYNGYSHYTGIIHAPEPSTLSLAGLGLLGLVGFLKLRRKQAA